MRQLSVTAKSRAPHHALERLYAIKRLRGVAFERINDDVGRGLLHEHVNGFAHTTIVLDALDDCDESSRTEIFDFLEDIAHKAA
jgi:hypothetical protein